MAEEIEIKIKIAPEESLTSIAAIKAELKSLNNQAVAIGAGGKGFEELTTAAGKLKNKLGDLNQTTSALNGSGVEKLTAGMGLLKEAFTTANPEKVAAGFSVIGTAMKAIPIFLVIEGIKYLIDNFEKLKNSGGLLGKAFSAIGDVISFVVQQLKDFADWIGITSFAADEAAQKTIDNAKAIGAANQARYGDEIALATAAGEDTTAIEKKKQEDIIKTSQVELEQIRIRAYAQGQLNDEQIKRVQELGKQIHDANLAIQVKEIEVEKKTQDEKNKLRDENSKKAQGERDKRLKLEQENNDKLIEQAKIGGAKIENLERELNRAAAINIAKGNEAKLELINQYLLEDLATEEATYKKSVVAAQNAELNKIKIKGEGSEEERLVREKYGQQLADATEYYNNKELAINKEKGDTLRIYRTKEEKDALDLKKKTNEELLQHDRNLIEHSKNNGREAFKAKKQLLLDTMLIEISNTELTEEQKKDIIVKYNDEVSALTISRNKEVFDQTVKTVDILVTTTMNLASALNDYYQTLADEESKRIEKTRDEQIAANDLAMQQELAVNNLTSEQKIAIRKKYEEKDYQLKLVAYNKETAIKRKAFEADKKMKIAQVVIETIKGAISTYSSLSSLGPYGVVLGAIAAAAVVATGAIQIAKIKATTFDSGAAPTPPALAEGTTAPSGDATGVGLERIGGEGGPRKSLVPTTGGGGIAQPTKVYVVSEDITSSQNKNAVLERRASFA